jgi:hypothetical protein
VTTPPDRGRTGFIPALRFDVLTPLFDPVAALFVRGRTMKRRVTPTGTTYETITGSVSRLTSLRPLVTSGRDARPGASRPEL